MPLLLLDLDNTLVDRDGAFRDAAAGFLRSHDLPEADLAWLTAVDDSGYTPRARVAEAVQERYGPRVTAGAVQELLDTGAADRVTLAPDVAEALTTVGARGWTSVIVTNGRTVQQLTKIRNTGLDQLVAGWIISEAAGCRKPEPEIFHAAARLAGLPLTGAWMIGDSPHADVGGAVALGLTSVWLPLGREWTTPAYRPDHIVPDVVTALRLVSVTATS